MHGKRKPLSGLLPASGASPPTRKISPVASQQRPTIPTFFAWGNLDTDIPPSGEAIEATRAASLFTVSPTRGRVTRWRRQKLAAAARITRSRTSYARSV
ncbi:MAG: hypothetical protein QOH62_2486 [Solirubrobacteraceae bacterium]|nr:hypothetical protein [Solirubrobacteraceae bacterium]